MAKKSTKALSFALPDETGKMVKLSDFKGRPVVVYFYPRDDTPGCTQEAKDFSCLADEFAAAGAEILGVSADSTASHAKFKSKHKLAVRLLADEDKKAVEDFGVWVEKSMYGKTYMGIDRSTFLFDKSGKLVKSWNKVRVPGHAQEVLAAVKDLMV